jgi:FlaA1/EpsC-like NDP-sugar epimerase
MNRLYKLINWYFKKDSLPYWAIILADCFVFYLAGMLVYWMFFRYGVSRVPFSDMFATLTLYLIPTSVCFKYFHTYNGVLRFSSFADLMKVAYAMLTAFAVSVALHYIVNDFSFPHIIAVHNQHLLAIYLIATILMWGERVVIKTVYDVTFASDHAANTLIFGTKSGAIGLAKSIRTEKPMRFMLKGFVSADNELVGHYLMGKMVFPNDEQLSKAIERFHIKAFLVSPLCNKEFRSNTALQDLLIGAGIRIYMSSQAKEWSADDDFSARQLQEVNLEDLLPRDQISVDMLSIGRQIAGKRILITGSAGSIGSEMVRQVAVYKPEAMMLIDQAETPQHDIRLMMDKRWPEIPCETVVTSICKEKRMDDIFSAFRPDYVFHAAAYKHVPMMENNPSEAVQNNIYGTKVIADLSVKYGVKKFVMVSTDKAVNPTNVMGCSKRICEIYVQSLNNWQKDNGKPKTQFVTTRFGNVLGSNGSVIPLFQEQIKKGGPVTVTHPDIIRFFMLIPEACKLVLEAGTKGHGGEIFVFDMGKPVRIADLAQRMIKLSGAKNVQIKYTGLRAGEKLYEEVLNEQESTLPSFHEKIRIAQVREYDYETASKDIDELVTISKRYDDMATVKKMKEIVPEYISKNSIYECLDKHAD